MNSLQARYTHIQDRITQAWQKSLSPSVAQKGLQPRPILIAVSKFQSVEAIEELYHLGHRDFGENYVQELAEKAALLEERSCPGIQWHFIGKLQTNKVKTLLPYQPVIHSVDSLRLAEEVSKRAQSTVKVFVSVNIDQEESKSGVHPDETPSLVQATSQLPHLEVLGLMCIPSPEGGQSGDSFRRQFALGEKCREWTQGQLSMGMTQDFEVAIREGSTHVRVGTALFGARPDLQAKPYQ